MSISENEKDNVIVELIVPWQVGKRFRRGVRLKSFTKLVFGVCFRFHFLETIENNHTKYFDI